MNIFGFSYLCGTEDGSIHRCSTIYNEKYLESYRGHTNPVYKIHWSPFAEDLFLSTSADWTIRIWILGQEDQALKFTSTTSNAFIDAIWSPKYPTILFAITENAIEIWDLFKSTYEICLKIFLELQKR